MVVWMVAVVGRADLAFGAFAMATVCSSRVGRSLKTSLSPCDLLSLQKGSNGLTYLLDISLENSMQRTQGYA